MGRWGSWPATTLDLVDHDEFVQAFGAAIEVGQASLLIGAGISEDADYPSWGELLEPVAQEFAIPPESDLPLLAQYIENKEGGRDALRSHVASEIGRVVPEPQENHRLLARLRIPVMWTTNYDPLIETEDSGLEVIAIDEKLAERSAGTRRLIKMHGSISAGANEPGDGHDQLVLSRDDYDSYEKSHPRMWRLLQAQFLTSSFCFLGFSMTDPNFEAVFRIARLETPDKMMQHYAVMKRPDDDDGRFDLKAGDLKLAGIELVEIADFGDITLLLNHLVARTKPAQLFVSGSFRSPEDEASTGTDDYPVAPPNENLIGFAKRLGEAFNDAGIPGVVAGGDLGASVGYAFLDALKEYDSSRFVLIRRTLPNHLSPPFPKRSGQMHFIGEDPSEMRGAAFDRVRAVAVLHGGPGTEEEARRAEENGMSVIPIAATGGVALKLWEEMNEDLSNVRIGLQPVNPQDFESLAAEDQDEAIRASVRLILQGLFLPQPDGI